MTAMATQAKNPANDVDVTTVELAVLGMTCAACVRRVENAVKKVPGVTNAQVNLVTNRATVSFGAAADLHAVAAAIEKAGYQPVLGDERADATTGDASEHRAAAVEEAEEREQRAYAAASSSLPY